MRLILSSGFMLQCSKKRRRNARKNQCIHLRLENPKIGGVDDAEIVGDRIAVDGTVFRHLLAQEFQKGSAEVIVGRVAAVVGHVLVH